MSLVRRMVRMTECTVWALFLGQSCLDILRYYGTHFCGTHLFPRVAVKFKCVQSAQKEKHLKMGNMKLFSSHMHCHSQWSCNNGVESVNYSQTSHTTHTPACWAYNISLENDGTIQLSRSIPSATSCLSTTAGAVYVVQIKLTAYNACHLFHGQYCCKSDLKCERHPNKYHTVQGQQ